MPNFLHFFFKTGEICSGSVIHSQWILTAAHCAIDLEGNIFHKLAIFFIFNSLLFDTWRIFQVLKCILGVANIPTIMIPTKSQVMAKNLKALLVCCMEIMEISMTLHWSSWKVLSFSPNLSNP